MDFSWLEKGISFSKYHLTIADLIYIVAAYTIVRAILYAFRVTITRVGIARSIETGKIYTIRKLVAYALYTFWAILSLEHIGIDITLFLAGSAALLVGVGLGLGAGSM